MPLRRLRWVPGRPVLVVPYNATGQKIGRRVLVARNGSREAARAVNDALPILRRADYVQVFSIDPEDIDSGQRLSGAAICQHLARHDVDAEASAARASDRQAGDRLNAQVANEALDVIVMGAYGHTRFRETIMGGVTRALLRHMIVPVFLSR
ncbi:MAG: universal stress protein [Gammaproteobacteria bacterium]